MSSDLYGTGWRWPLRVTADGRLALISGEESLWQGVEEILRTPLGSRPLDPTFGVPPIVLEPIGQPEALAYAVGRAVERCEPRAQDVGVDILREDAASGTLELRISVTPIDSNVALNRTFPFYRKS